MIFKCYFEVSLLHWGGGGALIGAKHGDPHKERTLIDTLHNNLR